MINQMSKFKIYLVLWFCINALATTSLGEEEEERSDVWDLGRPFVKREERRSIVSTENGEISGARVSDGDNGIYLLHFITLEPNSLFLPVLLHSDMVFYVHTGTGSLGWNEEDEMRHANVKKGDVYRLPGGTVFFAQSSLESERQKLRIYAIFANSINDLREPIAAPYTTISDLVLGFDKDVLQAAFSVPESVIEELLGGTKQPAIIHGQPQTEQTLTMWDKQMEYVKQLVGKRGLVMSVVNKKKKKYKEEKMYNIIDEDKDFQNSNGWSSTVTSKHLDALKGSDIGIFMVNLTNGSMMGPHWNPMATEIAIALQGQGMVRVVCPKTSGNTSGNVAECRDMRFHVNEGDVFVVPRFHPMAQMAFSNGSFVFMGFSTSAKNNHPQFLTGKASVFRTLDVDVVAASFNVTNTTITRLLDAQDESVILKCVPCAEEELRVMQEEMEREMEERKKREEEEAREAEEERKREEEEAKEEEEEKAKREEEERKQREEEEAKKKEEEEEERKRQQEEEEEKRKQEEEERRKEEEAAKREEEERKQKEEEEARRKEEEEEKRKRREEEEREEEQRRAEEQRKQEEEAQKKEEEAARREEEERKQKEEEEARRKQEEEARKKQEEEAARKREEEQRKQEEEEQKKEEEEARREEEERKQREEEEARGKEEEERKRQAEAHREEEEVKKRKEEQRKQEEEARRKEEGEAQKEEEERKQREQQETKRKEEEKRQRREEKERTEEEEAVRREYQRRKEEEARRKEEEVAQREEEERQQREKEEARRQEEEARKREEEREAHRRKEEAAAQEEQEQARKAEEAARRPAEEAERQASEEAARAAEEEQKRKRRQREPEEGRGGRGE